MNKSESIAKLSLALSKFQGEVKNPPNSANNPFFKSKYAPLDVVINTIKPVLAKYGLSYIQMPGGDGEHVTCSTILMCEGEWLESDVLVLKADKITAQGAGSAISYARRYQLTAILGLAGEEDDDAEFATHGNKQTNNSQYKTPQTHITPPNKPTQIPNQQHSAIISDGQAKRLYAISKGNAELAKKVLLEYGYSSSKLVENKNYKIICEKIEKAVAVNE